MRPAPLLAAIALLAASGPLVEAPGGVTLHLHGPAPVGNADQALAFLRAGDAPFMDASPPEGNVPRVSQSTQGANNVRQNAQLAYWVGHARGHVGNVTATLWVAASAPTMVEATLFGDGGRGSAMPLARGATLVSSPVPAPVTIAMLGSGMVSEEVVLSVFAGISGAQVYYDSTTTDSTLSFDLGPFEPRVERPLVPEAADGWLPVVLVDERAHRETSLALDPTNASRLVACSPSGAPNVAHGQSYFWSSTDEGASWRAIRVESQGADARWAAFEGGDCDVAFDAGGTLYVADTWLGELSVGRSRDGGASWNGTPVAVSAPIVDRPWLVGGADGVVHLSYQDLQFAMPSLVWYTRSDDHGATFLPAVPVTTANPDGGFTWQGNFVVSPDGRDVFLAYTRRAEPSLDSGSGGPESVWVAASHDGGLTWESRLVALTPTPASHLYPSIAMDAGGILHVAYSSSTESDHPVWYASSRDGARSWSEPVKLLSGVSAFGPWIVGGAKGEAIAMWYGSPDPRASRFDPADWYAYVARIRGADAEELAIQTERTTKTPLFSGIQSALPEFNQVRIAPDGRILLGVSAYRFDGGAAQWATYFLSEAPRPSVPPS